MLDGTTYSSVRETQSPTTTYAFRSVSPDEINALVREAQQMRAAVIGNAIAGVIAALVIRYRNWSEHRKTVYELQHLDDRMLADIGVTREQIAEIVDGTDETENRGGFRAWFAAKILAPARRWRVKVRTSRELSALDDSMLRDIGIERGQIEGIAAAAAEGKVNQLGGAVPVGLALGWLDLPTPANSNSAKPRQPAIVDAAD